MKITEMSLTDIDKVIPLYIEYYNNIEGRSWNEMTVRKRIRQVLTIDDSFSLIMMSGDSIAVGFVMGYFKQYDDIVGYTLEEIVISSEYQHKGYGSVLLNELEKSVREKGASCVELQSVNDELHEQYYGKAGYRDTANFVMKVKWFD